LKARVPQRPFAQRINRLDPKTGLHKAPSRAKKSAQKPIMRIGPGAIFRSRPDSCRASKFDHALADIIVVGRARPSPALGGPGLTLAVRCLHVAAFSAFTCRWIQPAVTSIVLSLAPGLLAQAVMANTLEISILEWPMWVWPDVFNGPITPRNFRKRRVASAVCREHGIAFGFQAHCHPAFRWPY